MYDCDSCFGTHPVNVVFAGDSNVGKTSIMKRFIDGGFDALGRATTSPDFRQKEIRVNDTPVKLSICDTAGQERFRCISAIYFRNADYIILTYSVAMQSSFDSLEAWVKIVNEQAAHGRIVVVANMVDLEDQRVVQPQDGVEFAASIDAAFLEVSAKTGRGVEEIFQTIGALHISGHTAKRNYEIGVEQKWIKANDTRKLADCCLH